jgi:type IV secretory pathway TrbD component
MTTNESTVDRAIRLLVAVVAAVVAFVVGAGSALGIVLLVVAAIMLVTAAVGFCPLYRVFGISTSKLPANR